MLARVLSIPPSKRVLLDEYGAEALKSALYTEAKARIDRVEQKAESLIASTMVAFTILLLRWLFWPHGRRPKTWLSLGRDDTCCFCRSCCACLSGVSEESCGDDPYPAVKWLKVVGLLAVSVLLLVGVYQAYQAVRNFSRETTNQFVDRRSAQDTLARQQDTLARQILGMKRPSIRLLLRANERQGRLGLPLGTPPGTNCGRLRRAQSGVTKVLTPFVALFRAAIHHAVLIPLRGTHEPSRGDRA